MLIELRFLFGCFIKSTTPSESSSSIRNKQHQPSIGMNVIQHTCQQDNLTGEKGIPPYMILIDPATSGLTLSLNHFLNS